MSNALGRSMASVGGRGCCRGRVAACDIFTSDDWGFSGQSGRSQHSAERIASERLANPIPRYPKSGEVTVPVRPKPPAPPGKDRVRDPGMPPRRQQRGGNPQITEGPGFGSKLRKQRRLPDGQGSRADLRTTVPGR